MLNSQLLACIQNLKKEKSQLYPTTFVEELINNYQLGLLSTLEGACKETNTTASLKKILFKNWTLIKGTCLSYTAQPEDTLTLLLCDIAEEISIKNNVPALNILMPTIKTESIHDSYPKLTGDEAPNVKEVLKTHILSQSGAYLIPIRVLGELAIPLKPSNNLYNYYYDYETMSGSDAYVNAEEYQRLLMHSKDTQNLSTLKDNYEGFLNDESCLLGQLNKLIKHLRFNSTSGVGQETRAGEGAYGAILIFNKYYNLLEDSQKNTIPEAVKSEIELLLNLSSDSTVNANATENMQTCLATRSMMLSQSVKAHEADLSDIGIDDNERQALLQLAKEQFESHQAELMANIKRGEYKKGHDSLGITHELLNTLNTVPTISSQEEFQDFLSLSAKDIEDIVRNNKAVRKGILAQIDTIESFLIFCVTGTTPDRLQAIVSMLSHKHFSKLVEHVYDLSACLLLLEGERLKIVCEAFKNNLPDIIQNGDDFGRTLEHLSTEQRTTVFNVFQNKLPDIITNGIDFGWALEHLSAEQCTIVCNAVKDELPDIITNGEDFGRTLEYLSAEQCTIVCNAVKDELSDIITNGEDFGWAFEHLSAEQCTIVCNAVKDKLSDIIENGYELTSVLKHLSAEQCTIFCNVVKDKLPGFIKNWDELASVLKHLSAEQCAIFCNATINKLPDIIKNAEEFGRTLKHLNAGQRTAVFNALQNKLPDIIQNGDDFERALKHLSAGQRTAVFNALQNKLPDIIENGYDFGWALKHLNAKQRTVVFNALLNKLPDIIEDGDGFGRALKHLSAKQCIIVCNAVKDKLPNIINDGYGFWVVLKSLSAKQSTIVCNAVKDMLPDILENGEEVASVLKHLSAEQRTAVLNAFQNKLADIIKNDRDYKAAFPYLQTLNKFKKKSKNIRLKTFIPLYFSVGLFVGVSALVAGVSISLAPLLALLTTGVLFTLKYYKKQQFQRLSYPLFFKSVGRKEDSPADNSDVALNAYNIGKDAGLSWAGYFTSYQKLDAYKGYNSYCTGQIEADCEVKGRRVVMR